MYVFSNKQTTVPRIYVVRARTALHAQMLHMCEEHKLSIPFGDTKLGMDAWFRERWGICTVLETSEREVAGGLFMSCTSTLFLGKL
jgi:hypothetical protein